MRTEKILAEYTCERCGVKAAYIEDWEGDEAQKQGWSSVDREWLCPHCMADFQRFMQGEVIESKNIGEHYKVYERALDSARLQLDEAIFQASFYRPSSNPQFREGWIMAMQRVKKLMNIK